MDAEITTAIYIASTEEIDFVGFHSAYKDAPPVLVGDLLELTIQEPIEGSRRRVRSRHEFTVTERTLVPNERYNNSWHISVLCKHVRELDE